MNLDGIKTIIFDLGGVIIDIDYNLTKDAFENLGIDDFNKYYSQASQTGIFDDYEVGKVSTAIFINTLLDLLPKGTTANQIVHAWNAMIKEIPASNIELIKTLKSKGYQVGILSNTNETHIDYFERKLHKHGIQKLNKIADFVHYSSVLGKRKPDVDTFKTVCELHQLNPVKTLFIDDSIQHIEGAKKIGLNTYHFTKGAFKLKEEFGM